MKNKTIKLLKIAYDKRLKAISNQINNRDLGLLYFTEHLKFLRDRLVIEYPERDFAIASITTALAEFEAYQNTQDFEQKAFHWNNFCDFLKLNTEAWLALNDSI